MGTTVVKKERKKESLFDKKKAQLFYFVNAFDHNTELFNCYPKTIVKKAKEISEISSK